MSITWYEHHGSNVAVRDDLKGRHREFCLCHKCDKFKPNTKDNCNIAQATYEHDVKYDITTPMWECPEFKEGE